MDRNDSADFSSSNRHRQRRPRVLKFPSTSNHVESDQLEPSPKRSRLDHDTDSDATLTPTSASNFLAASKAPGPGMNTEIHKKGSSADSAPPSPNLDTMLTMLRPAPKKAPEAFQVEKHSLAISRRSKDEKKAIFFFDVARLHCTDEEAESLMKTVKDAGYRVLNLDLLVDMPHPMKFTAKHYEMIDFFVVDCPRGAPDGMTGIPPQARYRNFKLLQEKWVTTEFVHLYLKHAEKPDPNLFRPKDHWHGRDGEFLPLSVQEDDGSDADEDMETATHMSPPRSKRSVANKPSSSSPEGKLANAAMTAWSSELPQTVSSSPSRSTQARGADRISVHVAGQLKMSQTWADVHIEWTNVFAQAGLTKPRNALFVASLLCLLDDASRQSFTPDSDPKTLAERIAERRHEGRRLLDAYRKLAVAEHVQPSEPAETGGQQRQHVDLAALVKMADSLRQPKMFSVEHSLQDQGKSLTITLSWYRLEQWTTEHRPRGYQSAAASAVGSNGGVGGNSQSSVAEIRQQLLDWLRHPDLQASSPDIARVAGALKDKAQRTGAVAKSTDVGNSDDAMAICAQELREAADAAGATDCSVLLMTGKAPQGLRDAVDDALDVDGVQRLAIFFRPSVVHDSDLASLMLSQERRNGRRRYRLLSLRHASEADVTATSCQNLCLLTVWMRDQLEEADGGEPPQHAMRSTGADRGRR